MITANHYLTIFYGQKKALVRIQLWALHRLKRYTSMENPEHPINGVYTNYHNSLSGVKVVSDYNITF